VSPRATRLADHAKFDEQQYAFSLTKPPQAVAAPVGRYQLMRGGSQPDMLAHAYRLSHPLGEWSIDKAITADTPTAAITFDYSQHANRVSVIEKLKGQSGWLTLAHLAVTAYETTENLLFTGLTDDGQAIDQETCEKLMAVQAKGKPTAAPGTAPASLAANSERQVEATIAQVLDMNQRLFTEERDKLEKWADDKLMASEEQLRNTKARIAQLKRDARKASTLQEQSTIQQELSDLERLQRKQRQEIFAVEDEIIERRDALIQALQERLKQTTETRHMFTLRWSVA
jgi:hypothetical protein